MSKIAQVSVFFIAGYLIGIGQQRLQKQLYLRKLCIQMFVEHIGIAQERSAVLHIEIFRIAVKIPQTDARQNTPAKAVPNHLLAGINAVNPHVRAYLGQIMGS
ncbi:MAG: hypothetical protein V8S58_02650 [Lachnospiraceae bacterium]